MGAPSPPDQRFWEDKSSQAHWSQWPQQPLWQQKWNQKLLSLNRMSDIPDLNDLDSLNNLSGLNDSTASFHHKAFRTWRPPDFLLARTALPTGFLASTYNSPPRFSDLATCLFDTQKLTLFSLPADSCGLKHYRFTIFENNGHVKK